MSLLQDGGVLKAYTDIINNPVYTSWLDYDEPPQNCQKRIRRAGYVRSNKGRRRQTVSNG
uniref:Uncharacterized protein n=1 Tax=Wuchereria bancrofti TaxID=6293 RepID=A0AAF5RT91_WUCBA